MYFSFQKFCFFWVAPQFLRCLLQVPPLVNDRYERQGGVLGVLPSDMVDRICRGWGGLQLLWIKKESSVHMCTKFQTSSNIFAHMNIFALQKEYFWNAVKYSKCSHKLEHTLHEGGWERAPTDIQQMWTNAQISAYLSNTNAQMTAYLSNT